MLNKKAQTALELLIVLGGVLIVGVVVVMILISTGSAKADDITQSDASHTQLLDKSVFPPVIDNLKCTENDTNITIEMDVTSSVSKNLRDYCLVINGETTEHCNLPVNDRIFFNINKISTNYYSIGLATRSNANTISSSSMTLSCSIAGTGTGGTGGVMSFTCPDGYTKVPGNSVYGTTYDKGGFCVMTWEAKVDTDGDGTGEYNENCTWNYSSSTAYLANIWFLRHTTETACNILEKTQGIDFNIVSSEKGYPFTGAITSEAKGFCENIGENYHLITNEEWMTIARNLEQQPENWSTGEVGFGQIKIGNVYQCPNNTISYSMGTNTGFFDFVGATSSYSNRTTNSPAKLILSNGEVLWDFIGNAKELIDKQMSCNQLPMGYDPNSYSQYIEFNQIQNNNALQDKEYKPGNLSWLSDKKMGKVRFEWNRGSNICSFLSGPYIHLVHNSCDSTGLYTKAGVRILTSSDKGYLQTIGFRCVYVPN
jgi:hypothetical protein